MPAMPPAPTLRHQIAPEKENATVTSPEMGDLLKGLEQEAPRRSRGKREFKRNAESKKTLEEETKIAELSSGVAQEDAVVAPSKLAASDDTRTVEHIALVEVPKLSRSASQSDKTVDATTDIASSAMDVTIEAAKPSSEANDTTTDASSLTEKLMEATTVKRQDRAKRGRAKKAEAVAPAPEEKEKTEEHATQANGRESDGFSMLNEAIRATFSPVSKSDASSSAKDTRRRGRAAKVTATAPVEEKETQAKPEDVDVKPSKSAKSRTAKGKKKTAAVVEEAPIMPQSIDNDVTMAIAELEPQVLPEETKVNDKKRSRGDSFPADLPLPIIAPSLKRVCTEDASSNSEMHISPSKQEPRSDSESTASTITMPSPRSAAPISPEAPAPLDMHPTLDRVNQDELLRVAFEQAEAEVYGNSSTAMEVDESSPKPSQPETAPVELPLAVIEDAPTPLEDPVPSVDDEPTPSPIEQKAEVMEPVQIVKPSPLETPSKLALKRNSEAPIPHASLLSTHAMLSSVSMTGISSMRASTNTTPALTSLQSTMTAYKVQAASRLNEKLQKIKENKAELDAKKRAELLAKQKEKESREVAKQQDSHDKLRERLESVRRRQESKSSQNLVKPVPSGEPDLEKQAIMPMPAEFRKESSVSNSEDNNDAPEPSTNHSAMDLSTSLLNASLPAPVDTTVNASAMEVAEEVGSALPVQKPVPKPTSLNAPWPPFDIPELHTPPGSPPPASQPPTLAETSSAMKLKKATPRRFLPGLLKEKTPAKTPASANKKGFWASINPFTLFGASSKKSTAPETTPSRSTGLISDSPLFVPTSKPAATVPVAPHLDMDLSTSTAQPEPVDTEFTLHSAFTSPAAKPIVSRSEASFSPLPSFQLSAISVTSNTSLDDSLLMPPPSKPVADNNEFQIKMDVYQAGLRDVPTLDTSSDDDIDDFLNNDSDDEDDARLPITHDMKLSPKTTPKKSLRSLPNMPQTDSSRSLVTPERGAIPAQQEPKEVEASEEEEELVVKLKTPPKTQPSRTFFNSPEYQCPIEGACDDDDDDGDAHQGPTWTRSKFLWPALENQSSIDPDAIFSDFPPTCDLADIFSENTVSILARPRTSSGLWSRDKLTLEEKREYKRRMGFAVKTLEKERDGTR